MKLLLVFLMIVVASQGSPLVKNTKKIRMDDQLDRSKREAGDPEPENMPMGGMIIQVHQEVNQGGCCNKGCSGGCNHHCPEPEPEPEPTTTTATNNEE